MDNIPLLKAKLVVPEIPGKVLYSNRLKNLKISGHRLVIISAPAGFGKTTAVLLSLKNQRKHIRWYRMEKEDSFLSVFYAHLIETLFGNHSNKNIDSVSSFGSIGKISEEYPLLNALICQDTWTLYPIGEPLFIVLDDFQNVSHNEAIVDTIRYFISNMPPNVRFIIASRISTGLRGGKFILNGDISFIDEDDLRFTKEEISELASDIFKMKAETDIFELLYDYSEGWIAGLTMIIHAVEPSRIDVRELLNQGSGKSQEIFEYLLHETLGGIDKETVKDLARISILSDFSCDELNIIFRMDNAPEIISWLEKSNMYIQKIKADRPRYRFHSLFRNVLNSMLFEFFTTIEINEMYRTAASYHIEHKEFKFAIKFLLAAGKTSEAVKLASTEGLRLMNTGDMDKVAPLVQEFPEETIQSNPYLLLFRGTALMNSDFEESYTYLFRALLGFRKNKNIELQMNVIGLIISMCYKRNDLKYLKSIFPQIPKIQVIIRGRNGRKILLLCAFMSIGWSDRLRLANLLYKLVNRLKITDPLWDYMLKLSKLGVLYREGNIEPAEQIAKQLFNHPTAITSDRWKMALLGLYHNLTSAKGDLLTSQRLVSELASIGEKYNSDYAYNHALRFDAYNKYQTRDIPTAIALLERLEEAYTRVSNPIMLCVSKITKYLWKSDMQSSETLSQMAYAELSSLPSLSPGQGFLELCQAITGALYKEAGDYTDAEKLLQKSFSSSKRKKAVLNICGSAMHLADLYYRKKSFGSELKYLKIWANIAASRRYAYFREMNYPTFVRVSARCIENNICADYIKKIVSDYFGASFADRLAGNTSEAVKDPKDFILRYSEVLHKRIQIKVNLFGSFKMVIDTTEINENEWKTRKICGILKYILANPGKTVSRDVLSSLFWPESDSKAASTSLRAALYELRKTLTGFGMAFESEDALIAECKNGFYQCSKNVVETDADIFTKLYKDYKSNQHNNEEKKNLLIKMTDLYVGDFLGDDLYDEWVTLSRENYRSLFIEGSHELAKIYINSSEFDQAEILLLRHMKVDPFDEKACGMLIHIYSTSGQKNRASSIKRQFEKRYEYEMGEKPDLMFS